MKILISDLRDAISRKDKSKAENLIVLALDQNPEKTIDQIRSDGVFRFSNYNFESQLILSVAKKAYSHLRTLNDERYEKYLNSVIALGAIAPAARSLLKRLKIEITPYFFKRYLVAVEHLFRISHVPNMVLDSTYWQRHYSEQLADGFSYYFSLLQKDFFLTVSHINHFPFSKNEPNRTLSRLASFADLVRFREMETLITSFPYFAYTDGQSTTVEAIDPEFEKIVRWGYMRNEQQNHADRLQSDEDKAPSLRELALLVVQKIGNKFFQIVGHPSPRIRLELPMASQFLEVFTGDYFFREDYALVTGTMKALFLNFEQLKSSPIYKSITLLDLIKFRRFCCFIAYMQDEFCRRKKLLDTEVYFRSRIIHFSEEQAFSVARNFCGIQNPKELFEVLSSVQQADGFFDFQRAPVIKLAGQYLIPPATVGNSNITANALQATRFRFDEATKNDPIGDNLVFALKESGSKVKTNVKFSFRKKDGEVDVLAFWNDELFAFECKNSLSPCSAHELRQSYGYLVKGFGQLSRFREGMANDEFVSAIRQKTGFQITNETKLHTCLVMGNRMFNGYQKDGHCVRNIYELANAITGGVAHYSFPASMHAPAGAKINISIPFRSGDAVCASDLVNYLKDFAPTRLAVDAMENHTETLHFGVKLLHFNTFVLDVVKYSKALQRKYQNKN